MNAARSTDVPARLGERDRVSATGRQLAVEVHADADDHRVELAALALRLDEHAGELATADEHVVRPLEHRRGARGARPHRTRRCRSRASSAERRASGSGGRSTADRYSPPGGDAHTRPSRPRPAFCASAITTVPCCAPARASRAASSFVEPHSASSIRWQPSQRAIGWSARGHVRTSRPMSTAGAECVSAPTEIRSAPARA